MRPSSTSSVPSHQSGNESQISSSPGSHETQLKGRQGQKRRSWTLFYRAWVTDWWLFELICLVFGTASMIAIVILLRHYQNKHIPGLNSFLGVNITLNTIISILGTLGRASLLYAVTECISQQRWAWFSGTARPLKDMESFDQGSRGPWGSFLLIWKLRVRHFVSLGAFLIIFALAVDPLSQQLVNYNLQLQADSSALAYVPTAHEWVNFSEPMFMTMTDTNISHLEEPPLYFKAAVTNGLFTVDSSLNETQAFCSTGNCTWAPYWSLSICSRWKDVSDHLIYTNISSIDPFSNETTFTERWALSDNNFVEANGDGYYYLNMSSAVIGDEFFNAPYVFAPENTSTIMCSNCTWPLADIFVIWRDFNKVPSNPEELFTGVSGENSYSALEFTFEWCAQEYKTDFSNGVSSTVRTESVNYTIQQSTDNSDWWIDASVPNPISNVTRFSLANSQYDSLAFYLWKTFRGYIGMERTQAFKSSDTVEAFYQYFQPTVGSSNSTFPSRQEILSNVDVGLKNMAISMTNALRSRQSLSQNISQSHPPLPGSNAVAFGTAWREQPIVQVQWGWIAAPIALVVLSIIFVLTTIVQSKMQRDQYGVWKSSALANMLSLGEDTYHRVHGLERISEMENNLRLMRVSLKRDADGKWRL